MSDNHRLLRIANRSVLLRAAVAAGLIAATVTLMAVSSSHASPVIVCNDRGCSDWNRSAPSVQSQSVSGTGRPEGCPPLWCGCWARLQVGLPKPFNRALHWLTLRRVPKQVGAWAVMRRKGGGHVGRVVRIDNHGNPVLISGNHNNRVATATYPARRIVAYVKP